MDLARTRYRSWGAEEGQTFAPPGSGGPATAVTEGVAASVRVEKLHSVESKFNGVRCVPEGNTQRKFPEEITAKKPGEECRERVVRAGRGFGFLASGVYYTKGCSMCSSVGAENTVRNRYPTQARPVSLMASARRGRPEVSILRELIL